MKIKLTARSFNTIEPPKGTLQRITPTNHPDLRIENRKKSKSFMFRYDSPITSKKGVLFSMGFSFPHGQEITEAELAEIIIETADIKRGVRRGIDPKVEAAKKKELDAIKQAKAKRLTMSQSWKEYIFIPLEDEKKKPHEYFAGDWGKLSENTKKNYTNAYRMHLEPRFGDVFVDEMKATEVRDHVNSLSPANGNRLLSLLKHVEAHENEKLADDDEFTYDFTKKTHRRKIPVKKERLEEHQIGDFFEWIETSKTLPDMMGNVLLMQLYGGFRVSEVVNMRWSWVNHFNKTIVIPWKFVKTQKVGEPDQRNDFVVPLTTPMIKVLEKQLKYGRDGLIFKSLNGRAGTIIASTFLTEHLRRAGFCSTHGLRKCAESITAGLKGMSEVDLKHLLNHAYSGTTSVYQMSDVVERKRKVLEAYQEKLEFLRQKVDKDSLFLIQ